MTEALSIDLLGPLTIRSGGSELNAGPVRQQALLAVLALRANHVTSPEQLLDLVWDEEPPATGPKVIPTYVYRIRKLLPPGVSLEHRTTGYVMHLPPDCLDVDRFETKIAAAAQVGDPALYREALALFRGEPLSGLPSNYLAAQRQRLIARRDVAVRDRLDLELAAGNHAELVPELLTLVSAHPLDERYASRLIAAQFHSGRQAEALETYAKTRATLLDELGVEPGPELRAVHQSVLRNESTGHDELPYSGATFIGRTTELATVVAALDPATRTAPPVVAIDGMAGIGKTSLAVQAGHRLVSAYPDGRLFVDLHGHTPGRVPLTTEAAIDHLLRGIGVPPQQIPGCLEDRLAMWRSKTAGRQLLIVLDNAPDARSVRPLLPGAITCAVLLTSRPQLTDLDTSHRIALELLPGTDAASLLTEIVGADRTSTEQSAVEELAERCGRLPLAIRIAGSRLRHRPSWTVAHFNQRLKDQDRRLNELSRDAGGVAPAFAVSYEQLPADQRAVFRRLGLMPGKDIDAYGAAALCELTVRDTEQILENLVDASLLLQPVPDRFEFHDLLREYAGQVAADEENETDRDAAIDRLLAYYAHTAHRSAAYHHDLLLDAPPASESLPDVSADLRWADSERVNLVAAVELAERTKRDELASALAIAVAPYLHDRGRQDELDVVLTAGLTAAQRSEDRSAEARLLYLRGHIGQFRCGPEKGVCDLRRSAELAADEAPAVRAHILGSLGYTAGALDLRSDWRDLLRESLRLAQLADDRRVIVTPLGHLAALHARQWEFSTALEYYEQALSVARDLGDERLQPDLLNGIARCLLDAGKPYDALQAARAAQRLASQLTQDFSLSYTLCYLGDAYRQLGWADKAVDTHQQALQIAVGNCTHLDDVDARLSLGASLLAAGRSTEADEQYALVLRLCEERGHVLGIAQALTGLADCVQATSPGQARALLERALDRVDGVHPIAAERLRARLTGVPAPIQ
ncbi:BTAD domain-containing putative transcriptional regulator [Kribbella sp. NPDC006257]|uniref:AfsR/SARP family transcriptional regulator n=1 Tax=Kribbella sp. NPDC006257 TaxID=3156738 RepID=UPI0033B93E49